MYFLIFTIDNQTNWLQSFFCHHYQLILSFSPGPLCSFSKCTYSKQSNRRAVKGLVFAKDCRGPIKKLNEVAPLLWHLFLWNKKMIIDNCRWPGQNQLSAANKRQAGRTFRIASVFKGGHFHKIVRYILSLKYKFCEVDIGTSSWVHGDDVDDFAFAFGNNLTGRTW